ncbi:hypothetical protein [Pseudomonas sp. SMV7]
MAPTPPALDLPNLPGFQAETDGLAKGYSEVEYARWKVGVR